jgi:hypothetical protein
MNVLYLDELVDWKMSQQFNKVNTVDYGAGLVGLHLVYLPSYMNVRVLPDDIKQQVYDKIHNLIDKYDNNRFSMDPYGKQRWLGLIEYMREDWTTKLPALKEYLEITDKTRGTSYTTTFPELKI